MRRDLTIQPILIQQGIIQSSSDIVGGQQMVDPAKVPGIAGIGVDLMRLDRIQRVFEKHGEKFVHRILGPQEIDKFRLRSQRDPQRGIRFLATRFAAKEAFSKAIGLGMHSPMAWSRMQTLNEPGGKPCVLLSEPLASWYAERFGKTHISVTDETDTVAAFVVVEALIDAKNLTEPNQ